MNDFLSGDIPALMDLNKILGGKNKWRTGEEYCAKPKQSRPWSYKNNIPDKKIGLIKNNEWKVEQVDVLHQRTTNGGRDVFIQ